MDRRAALSAALAAALIGTFAPRARAGEPTDEEARAWAKRVETTITAREGRFLDESVDLEEVLRRGSEGLTVKAAIHDGLLKGMKKAPVGTQLVSTIGPDGTFKFLKLVARDGAKVALFRFVSRSGGFGYEEFYLDKKERDVRAVDRFSHVSGEKMSATLRRNMLALVADDDKSAGEHLAGAENEYLKHASDVAKMTRLARSDPKEALATYDALPDVLKKDRGVLLIRLRAAQALGVKDRAYADALDTVDQLFGKETWARFVLLDRLILNKEWKRVFETLDAIDAAVGGDAYIDLERALIHEQKGDLDASKAAAQKALEKEPDLLKAHWQLIGIALAQKDWKAVRTGLERLEKLGVPLKDLESVPAFAGFVKTDEYATWKKSHPPKTEKDGGDK